MIEHGCARPDRATSPGAEDLAAPQAARPPAPPGWTSAAAVPKRHSPWSSSGRHARFVPTGLRTRGATGLRGPDAGLAAASRFETASRSAELAGHHRLGLSWRGEGHPDERGSTSPSRLAARRPDRPARGGSRLPASSGSEVADLDDDRARRFGGFGSSRHVAPGPGRARNRERSGRRAPGAGAPASPTDPVHPMPPTPVSSEPRTSSSDLGPRILTAVDPHPVGPLPHRTSAARWLPRSP